MGINSIMNIFKKKSNHSIEDDIVQEVIQHNTEESDIIYAKIIEYYINPDDEENEVPNILFICDFHNSVMPDINSIIWCPNKAKDKLEPYKVIRFDFIEDLNTDLNKNVFIVVTPAKQTDII